VTLRRPAGQSAHDTVSGALRHIIGTRAPDRIRTCDLCRRSLRADIPTLRRTTAAVPRCQTQLGHSLSSRTLKRRIGWATCGVQAPVAQPDRALPSEGPLVPHLVPLQSLGFLLLPRRHTV
jgi:hypothetical protein